MARCSVRYQGRLGARLAKATRLIVLKADGSIAIHSDAKAFKPLNWMNPPCTITEADGMIRAETPKGEVVIAGTFSDSIKIGKAASIQKALPMYFRPNILTVAN